MLPISFSRRRPWNRTSTPNKLWFVSVNRRCMYFKHLQNDIKRKNKHLRTFATKWKIDKRNKYRWCYLVIIDKLEKDRMFYDLYRMEIKTLRLISIISKVLCFQLNFWLLAYLLQSVLRWHLLILPLLFFHSNLRRIFHEEKLFYRLCYYNKVIYMSKDSGIMKYESRLFLCPYYVFLILFHYTFPVLSQEEIPQWNLVP